MNKQPLWGVGGLQSANGTRQNEEDAMTDSFPVVPGGVTPGGASQSSPKGPRDAKNQPPRPEVDPRNPVTELAPVPTWWATRPAPLPGLPPLP